MPNGGKAHVALAGKDILVAKGSPGPTSARNELQAQLVALHPVGPEILVELRVGDTRLLARITPAAVPALGLEAGQQVHLLVKSTACQVLLQPPLSDSK